MMSFEESVSRAVDLMTNQDMTAQEKDEAFRQLAREDGRGTMVTPGWARVGDRVCVAGYFKDDGWATVVDRDDEQRLLLVVFDDGEPHFWEWGPRGAGAHLLCHPGPA